MSEITLAEFWEGSTQSALARWSAEINEPTFRYGRTRVSRSADCRPTPSAIADNLSIQLSRWGELLFSTRTTIVSIYPSHGKPDSAEQGPEPSRPLFGRVRQMRGDRP